MIRLTPWDPRELDEHLATLQAELGLEVCVASEVVAIDKSLLQELQVAVLEIYEKELDPLSLPPEIQTLMRLQLEQHRLLLASCIQEPRSFVLYPQSLALILGTSVIRLAEVHSGEKPLGEFDGTRYWFVVKD